MVSVINMYFSIDVWKTPFFPPSRGVNTLPDTSEELTILPLACRAEVNIIREIIKDLVCAQEKGS